MFILELEFEPLKWIHLYSVSTEQYNTTLPVWSV